jgi:hypothetical protein
VEAYHQDFQWAGRGERSLAFAKEANEFVVDDFYDLLTGGDGLEDLLADARYLDAFDEISGYFKVYVSGKKSGAHFFECVGHVFFSEFADAAEVAESAA